MKMINEMRGRMRDMKIGELQIFKRGKEENMRRVMGSTNEAKEGKCDMMERIIAIRGETGKLRGRKDV